MKRSLTACLAVLGLVALGSAAEAATYDFSFDNLDGPVAGTVSGYIVLGDGDGTFTASTVKVTGAPAALGYTLDYDVLANMLNVIQNSFVVSGGLIDSANSVFSAKNGNDSFYLNYQTGNEGTLFNIKGSAHQYTGVQDTNSSILTYSVSTVPLPAAAPLLIVGLVGLGLLGRKRRAA
ncbi:MAG: hypothetical protein ACJAVR_000128 [Paracoccaceae bacterium]|jgi:hypothetical protein